MVLLYIYSHLYHDVVIWTLENLCPSYIALSVPQIVWVSSPLVEECVLISLRLEHLFSGSLYCSLLIQVSGKISSSQRLVSQY